MPNDPENEVLGRFTQGDPAAFEALFRQREAEVLRWAHRIVRDSAAAEDVAIEAFWRAHRGRAGFDASRCFGAWMRRITTNAALDKLRAARGRVRCARPTTTHPHPPRRTAPCASRSRSPSSASRPACASSRRWR